MHGNTTYGSMQHMELVERGDASPSSTTTANSGYKYCRVLSHIWVLLFVIQKVGEPKQVWLHWGSRCSWNVPGFRGAIMQICSHSPTLPSLHRFLTAARDPSLDNLYFSAANQTGRLLLADCAENPAPGCSQTPFNCCEVPPLFYEDNNQQSQCSARS